MPRHPLRGKIVPLKAIGYILLAGCIAGILMFAISAFGTAAYPFGLDFGEGYLLEHSRRIAEGENIYGDIDEYPYTVCNYPPLYPAVSGLLMKITGLSIAPGRWVSIIATLACCWLIGFIILRLTGNQLYSVVCGMMFVAIPSVFRWGQVMRVDAFSIALVLGGLAIYIAGSERRKLWCIPFFIAAFLTKQSMLAAPVAVIAHQLMTDRKSGIRYLLLTLAGGAVVYIIIDLLTGGGMHRHTFQYTANAFYTERLAAGINIYLVYAAPVLIIAVFHLFSGKASFRESPIPLYFILATLTLLTYGYEGSDRNYFLEPFAAALLLSGVAIGYWISSARAQSSRTAWAGAFMVVLLLSQLVMVRVMRGDEFKVMHVGPPDIEQGRLLVKLIENTPGDVISEDASFQVLAGKPVLFEPYIMTLLAERGKWDEGPFVDDISAGKFSLIVLRFDVNNPNHEDRGDDLAMRLAGYNRFSDEMEQAIREAYELDASMVFHSIRPWYVYKPRH